MIKIYKLVYEENVIYIGQTTQSIGRRVRKGGHNNIPVEIYEKCVVEVIEETDDIRREQYWIDYYIELGCKLYNKNRSPQSLSNKEYYDMYRDEILEHKKEYYEENRELLSEKGKTYYKDNKEYVKGKSSEYYYNNRDKKLQYQKDYQEKNKEAKKEYNRLYNLRKKEVKKINRFIY